MEFKLDETDKCKSTHLNVYCDSETRNRLDSMMAKTGLSMQAIVSQMIRHCLSEMKQE